MDTARLPPGFGPALITIALLIGACAADPTDSAGGPDSSAGNGEPEPAGTLGAEPAGEAEPGDPARAGDERSGATTGVAPPTTQAPPPPPDPTATAPDQLATPTTPDELAAALSAAESAIRDATIDQETRAAWARRQQRLYRELSVQGSWGEAVLAAVDPAHTSTVASNLEARLALDALLDTSRLSDTLPAWRIEAPAPAEALLGYYREAAEQTGVPWEILAAINLIETRMGRINGISTAGAVGPMQFLPSTWAECCQGDPTDDRDAIVGAATYLVNRGALTDLDRAIHGYNNSNHYVRAVRAYAAVMADDPSAYYGFHAWEVYFLSTAGLVWLPVGYEEPEAVDATAWLAANPDRLVDLASP